MTDHTTTRATPLRRVGCALTIALALGLGVAGTASAAAATATPLHPGVNDIMGRLGAWSRDTEYFTCPAGLGIQDVKTSSPHSDSVYTRWGVWSERPLQLAIAVHNSSLFYSKWYHVRLRCDGPITDHRPLNRLGPA